MTTFKFVKMGLRALGLTINKNRYGEYRVNYIGGKEATAYYTNDVEDAWCTGQNMANNYGPDDIGLDPPGIGI